MGTKILDKVMSRYEFFKQNPQYRYAVLEKFIGDKFAMILFSSFSTTPVAFYEEIKMEFKDFLGEQDVLVSVLCAMMNDQQKKSLMDKGKFYQFAIQAQKRIAELEAQLKTK